MTTATSTPSPSTSRASRDAPKRGQAKSPVTGRPDSGVAKAISVGGGQRRTRNKEKVQTSLLKHFAKIKSALSSDVVINSSPTKSSGDPGRTSVGDAIESTSSQGDGERTGTGDAAGDHTPPPSGAIPVGDQPKPVSVTDGKRPVVPKITGIPGLSAEERELFSLEIAQIPGSWLDHLGVELSKPYFYRLKKVIRAEQSRGAKIFPPDEAIYSWARLCPFERVKIVIIGQDPYHNDKQATGLCFSVPEKVPIPPSLLNIYRELTTDIPGFKAPPHGDLSRWAERGVLLLNTSLTVRAHEPASHAGIGWEQFTDAVIRTINRDRKNVVFILWGNHAQKKASMIDRQRHLVLAGVHPSPLSASRGFFGCRHFSKANEYLKSNGLEPIDWSLQ